MGSNTWARRGPDDCAQRTAMRRGGRTCAPIEGAGALIVRTRCACENQRSTSSARTMEPSLLDELNDRMRQVFAQSPAADLERNLRAMLAALFARLDLVTREEFDVQRQVL